MRSLWWSLPAVASALFLVVVPSSMARAAPPEVGGTNEVPQELATDRPPETSTPKADRERAATLLQQAQARVARAKSAVNADQAEKLRTQARAQIDAARSIHQRLHDSHQTDYESFPKHPLIDRNEQQARDAAELGYITARIDLARCTYETAQTFAEGTAERQEALKKAAAEFEWIRSAYRTMTAGLFADLWRGKCFHEMGEIGKALGIYNSLLEYDGSRSSTLRRLQDQAQHFQLMCLNDPQRAEHLIVLHKATEWLKGRKDEQDGSPTALGIRWERAYALERLAGSPDLPANDRNAFRRQAIDDAGIIKRHESPWKDAATRMESRLVEGEAISIELSRRATP